MSSREIVVPKCGGCGGRLTIMRYRAADGDMLFPGSDTIIEGRHAPVQTRSLFLCPTCDRLDLMPRAQR